MEKAVIVVRYRPKSLQFIATCELLKDANATSMFLSDNNRIHIKDYVRKINRILNGKYVKLLGAIALQYIPKINLNRMKDNGTLSRKYYAKIDKEYYYYFHICTIPYKQFHLCNIYIANIFKSNLDYQTIMDIILDYIHLYFTFERFGVKLAHLMSLECYIIYNLFAFGYENIYYDITQYFYKQIVFGKNTNIAYPSFISNIIQISDIDKFYNNIDIRLLVENIIWQLNDSIYIQLQYIYCELLTNINFSKLLLRNLTKDQIKILFNILYKYDGVNIYGKYNDCFAYYYENISQTYNTTFNILYGEASFWIKNKILEVYKELTGIYLEIIP